MYCSSGKVTFQDRASAKRSARTIKVIGSGRRMVDTARLRPYRCPMCGLFHLTSQKKRVQS